MDKTRLASLSDAVFAVAITLLILDIKIPAEPMSTTELWHALQALIPNIVAYVLSFCIIGILWNGHHTILNLTKAIDRPFIWLNLLYLMIVAFMPFPTAVLANHYAQQPAIILYSSMLLLVGLLHWYFLYYLRHRPQLLPDDLPPEIWTGTKLPSLFGAICGITAILASFISPKVSLLCLFLVPLYYIFINRTNDRLTKNQS